jgi:hypothetical protein
MKEKVLKLMLQNFTQVQIAEQLKIQKHEVMNYQQELIDGGYTFGTTKSSIINIHDMEKEAFEIASNWDNSVVDIDRNKRYNELLFKLETARI